MPTYDYTCITCGKTFEIHHKMSDVAPDVAPGCKAQNCKLEKKLTAPASFVKSSNPLAGHSLVGSNSGDSRRQAISDLNSGHNCGSGCTFHRH